MSGHAAVTALGTPYVAPGFDHEAHNHWAAQGKCPVVSRSKAWCSLKAGHTSAHGSPILRPDGKQGWTHWDE